MKRTVCVLSLLVLASTVAQADTISLIANRDNYLMGAGSAAITDMNYGAANVIVAGQGDVYFASCTGILGFDVSAIPVGDVSAITLRLHSNSWVDGSGPGRTINVNVNAMLPSNKGWVEGTGPTDAGAKLAGSCFDWKDSSEAGNVNWASGGQFGSSDYSATLLSTRTVGASDVGTYVDFTLAGTPAELTSLINGWRTDNAGLVVSATQTTGVILMRFDSRDCGTAAYCPELLVTVLPEPSACMLAASGLIGLLAYAWRRRG